MIDAEQAQENEMSKEIARTPSDGEDATALVKSAALDLGLPVIAAMSGWLPLMLVATFLRGGRSYASAVKSPQVRAEIAALRRHVDRVEQRLRREIDRTPEEVRAIIERPDMLKLLATARDEYAVDQMQPRLATLAAIMAGRATRPGDDIDKDLRLARAALEVSPLAIDLLVMMVDRGEHAVRTRTNSEPDTYRVQWGQVSMAEFLSARSWTDPEAVTVAVAAVTTAERHNLILRAEERPPTSVGRRPQVAEIRCRSGATAFYPNEFWWPTPWGFDFVKRVRETETDVAASQAGSK